MDRDAEEICCLYVTPVNVLNFPDDSPSNLIDKFKDHSVLVFDLTSMQDATEKCQNPFSWSIQFLRAEVQTEDAIATTIPSQRLRFLHDIYSF